MPKDHIPSASSYKKIPISRIISAIAVITSIFVFLQVMKLIFPFHHSQRSRLKTLRMAQNDVRSYGNEIIQRKKKKIGYAITITKDGPFLDGALVLGHSALRVHDINHGFHSEYEAELIAFVVKSVVVARDVLTNYGWKIIERELPVKIDEISNARYAKEMRDSGCCGADEFLKLWAFTLTEYHRVVHLDMDFAIFQNMVCVLDFFLIFRSS